MQPETLLPRMKRVEMTDKPIFDAYFAKHEQEICEMTFSNMLCWGESREHLWTEIEGHLVASFKKRDQERKWYPPVGPDPAHIIRDVLSPAHGYAWLYVNEKTAMQLAPSMNVTETPENFDYIYRPENLRNLSGASYMEKRNFINRLKKKNPEVIALHEGMSEECGQMMKRWTEEENRPGLASVLDEISALRLAMTNFGALGLIGTGVRIDGVMQAFAIAAPLSSGMMVEHFEKATNAAAGLYPFVLHELARALPAAIPELNREEDLGIPGLRIAKERWHPARMVKKYAIS